MREFQRHRNLENPEINKYRAGYSDCIREVSRYLATPEPLPSATLPSLNDPGSKARLLRHLDACLLEIESEMTNVKDVSMPSRDYLRAPSSSILAESSQDSINPLDYSKINHEGALNLTKNPPTANSAILDLKSGDENNNGNQQHQLDHENANSSVTSTSLPLANDNFSTSFANKQSHSNDKKTMTVSSSNKVITSGKRNKSFADKSDDSKSSTIPIPPKKAMIKSVEKERIVVCS